jgi:hypothetical protein
LRRVFVTNVMIAALGLPAIVAAAAGGGLVTYAWALAIGQLVGTFIVARAASHDLQRDWLSRTAGPPVTAAFLAAVVVITLRPWTANLPLVASVLLTAVLFGLTILLALRVFFSRQLREVLLRFPQGERLIKLLRIS